jgi:tetratricopeptide (TPR) repeat protein
VSSPVSEKTPAAPDQAQEARRLLQEGREHLAEGRLEAARVRLSEALRISPKDLDARSAMADCATALGDAAVGRGEVESAIANYQMALELAPFHPAADAGLRRAAKLAPKNSSDDPLIAAIDALPPVRALRDLQTAERVVARMTRTTPASTVLRERLDTREAQTLAAGGLTREQRVEHEMAAAWRRRWLFRALPVVALGASGAAALVLGAPGLVMWGVVLALFAVAWDLLFVERGVRFARLDPPAP